jgi:triosephosphate isomerase
MLARLDVAYVIVGHSERRLHHHEDDLLVARKARAVLAGGLRPIVCVGEGEQARESGKAEDVVLAQVRGSLDGVQPTGSDQLVIAYEPVWAIGTGVTATSQQAQDAHAFVRTLVAELYGNDTASRIRIQYGGSVKPNNAAELMACPDIDGALIGGAALEPQSFLEIIRNGCGQ